MTKYTKPQIVDQYFSAREYLDRVIDQLQSEQLHMAEHGEVEALIQEKGRELQRQLMQSHLNERAAKEVKNENVRGQDGRTRPHCRTDCRKNLTTVFGTVVVQRKGYNDRKLNAVFPLDRELNLPSRHKYSACLQRLIAELVPNSSFEDTAATIFHITGNEVGKRQIEEVTQHISQDFIAYYQQRASEEESSDDLLVMSCDGKGVVMRKEDLREATRKLLKESRTS